MRNLLMTATTCAMLAAAPAAAQTAAETGTDIYRNDLPETHDGFSLPEIGSAADADALTGSAESRQALEVIGSGAIEAQQFGNLAAAKHASGVVRDLGDVMILLHDQINERLDQLGADGEHRPVPETMSERAQARLNEIRDLNDREFNLAFADWLTDSYPSMIAAWERLRQSNGFEALAEAVLPQLEGQLRVAEEVVDAAGDLQQIDPEIARVVTAGGGGAAVASEPGPTGAAGQTGERQHTAETEPPTVQTGENYQHEQVEVDPQTQTRAPLGADGNIPAPIAAGDLEVINSAGLFMALDNPQEELTQLNGADFPSDRVRVVPAREVMEAAELEDLEARLAGREAAMRSFRAAIGDNEAIRGALKRANASIDNVIALDVIGDGAVVYTRTR